MLSFPGAVASSVSKSPGIYKLKKIVIWGLNPFFFFVIVIVIVFTPSSAQNLTVKRFSMPTFTSSKYLKSMNEKCGRFV